MNRNSLFNSAVLIFIFILSVLTTPISYSQEVVGLDTWFNHEINSSTGNAYHYLWNDTAMSGFSVWGEIFTEKGAVITTIGKPESKDLDRIDIYIIVDPDTTTENPSPNYISVEDIKAVTGWVRNGGVLVVMANDAPNCEFTHLNRLMKEFGMHFNHVTLHTVQGDDFNMGASVDLPRSDLFRDVRKIYLKEISDISLSGNAQALLKEKGKVLMAETSYGKGYVFAIGDPWIYNEYIDHRRLPAGFDNMQAAEDLTDLLLEKAMPK
ncbi:MAG TPA: DUF4350 domain-containing protein [Bacteroidales bacterium]|nr:DUF4350 domain-containing protein [Bacteroidales bacterium]